MKPENDILQSIASPRFMVAICAAWFVVASVLSLKQGLYLLSIGQEVYWTHKLLFYFSSALSWAVLTPVILIVNGWLFLKGSKWGSTVLLHLVFAALLIPVKIVLFLLFYYIIPYVAGVSDTIGTFSGYLAGFSFTVLLLEGLMTYTLFTGLLTGYLFYIRNKKISLIKTRLEKKLFQSRIQLLKYQLHPHFLFNSMQTISNLMHKDISTADKAISGFSDILRFFINQLDTDYITLREEIDITKKYLNFQKLRFNENLRYSIAVSPGLGLHKIPSLLLQPLVENSIKHGFEKTGRPVSINISVRLAQNMMVFEVTDDGPGLEGHAGELSNGTGIKNLENRLNYFYNDNHKLQITTLDKGTKVSIKIPKHPE